MGTIVYVVCEHFTVRMGSCQLHFFLSYCMGHRVRATSPLPCLSRMIGPPRLTLCPSVCAGIPRASRLCSAPPWCPIPRSGPTSTGSWTSSGTCRPWSRPPALTWYDGSAGGPRLVPLPSLDLHQQDTTCHAATPLPSPSTLCSTATQNPPGDANSTN